MRSSTSSSKRQWRDLWHAGLAVWVAVMAAATAALFAPAAAATADIVSYRPPPDGYYLAHDRGGHVDHHVLFHGIDGVARERLRAADVLFLGNSRLMFALTPAALRAFFAASDQRYYVLGFGHEEQDDFPLQIIRTYDLRPSLVVINADQFFSARRSEWASQVIEESGFDAWKIQLEAETSHRVRRVLHRYVPHYVDLRRGQREVVLFRSREDGSWFVANELGPGTAFQWPESEAVAPEPAALEAAAAFKRELDARGTRLVLTIVPAPGVSLSRAQAIAAHLSVPLLVPAVSELRTIDNSHLSEASAGRVAGALLESLRPFLR